MEQKVYPAEPIIWAHANGPDRCAASLALQAPHPPATVASMTLLALALTPLSSPAPTNARLHLSPVPPSAVTVEMFHQRGQRTAVLVPSGLSWISPLYPAETLGLPAAGGPFTP